ncbi:unnamed protein product [Porites evermanni]|uniref:USP domain-containing protein n=1 Tax=Porites evermanni TaxID=104178 RepID=A0ABN8R0U6_9CNID|nr:unnamed protein product [Porites evermanni]
MITALPTMLVACLVRRSPHRTGSVMPSRHQSSSSGRYVPYGRRKKREPKSYDMKLVLVDFIREVNDTGKTESYDGSVLLEAPFRVRENESDSSIRTRILAIVKSRFPSFNETVLYASRQGRVVLNLSPCQTLDGKAVYTLKSKSTNNLYVMLSAPATDRPPPDGDDEEEREHENYATRDGGLLSFSASTPRSSQSSETRGRQFRRKYLRSVASTSGSAQNQVEDIEEVSDDDDSCIAKANVCVRAIYTAGFYNPYGKSCGITASLSLMQYIKPFMELVASRKGEIGKNLHEIKMFSTGLKDKRILKLLDRLRVHLRLPVDEDIDANEFMHKLLEKMLQDEDVPQRIFCGTRKEKVALNSSGTNEILLQRFNDKGNGGDDLDEGNSPTTLLGLPITATNGVMSLSDLLYTKLNETRMPVPFSDWESDWNEKYQGNEDEQFFCYKSIVYDCVPKVAILGLQRGKKDTLQKDNRPIEIPKHIPMADFTNPEDEGVHSVDCERGTLVLHGMIVHSEVRNHQYAMIAMRQSIWIVHDGLNTYEVELTTELLMDLGGKDRYDSSVTFIYIESTSDLAIKKPPLPDKREQKDILKRYGKEGQSDDDCIEIDDNKEVDYQRIFHEMEASTRAFVGLEPLKQQFLRLRFCLFSFVEPKVQLLYSRTNVKYKVPFPGTGKTTFARKVVELLYSIRKIKKRKVVEVQRGDLVGQFLGSTEEKTANKIEEAKRGVLFVDEAYRLTPRSSGTDYGRIAINQLMAAMEKGDPVMIFAGYPAEMKDFLNSNPGLKSRIKYKFNFTDYSVSELATILENGIADSGFRFGGETSLVEIP